MAQQPLVFRGTVEKGKLSLDSPGAFRAVLARLEGKNVTLKLTRHHHKRSLSQNAYLWGVVYPLFGEAVGYECEELHDAMKHRFLRDRENEVGGLVRIKSSADLDTAEFTRFIEQVRQLAAENGVNIPDPGACE